MPPLAPSDPAHPSRRSVLRATAWTVPVISVATVVPAHAVSADRPTLSFRPGDSHVVAGLTPYFDLVFQGASVAITGGSLEPETLVLTISFRAGDGSRDLLYRYNNTMSGWVASGGSGAVATAPYTYGAGLTETSAAPVEDRQFVGTEENPRFPAPAGTFTVTVAAPGANPGTWTIGTSAAVQPADRATTSLRPRR